NAAVDDVRRRVQQEVLGHRGRKGDPLYGIRRLLLVGAERLGERGRVRIAAGLAAGDRFDEVGAAWTAKELLRAVYAADDVLAARRALVAFYEWCAEVQVPEVTRLAKTVSAWEHEVLAYHTTGLSNGPTEAVNLLIEKVRRIGHGFRNFDNYRLRLLLRCGVTWHTRTCLLLGSHDFGASNMGSYQSVASPRPGVSLPRRFRHASPSCAR
ncbi:MAG: transposase, partial [Actinobacteria bacterium]|nr:transposase [Actinomycetota bacterium]